MFVDNPSCVLTPVTRHRIFPVTQSRHTTPSVLNSKITSQLNPSKQFSLYYKHSHSHSHIKQITSHNVLRNRPRGPKSPHESLLRRNSPKIQRMDNLPRRQETKLSRRTPQSLTHHLHNPSFHPRTRLRPRAPRNPKVTHLPPLLRRSQRPFLLPTIPRPQKPTLSKCQLCRGRYASPRFCTGVF